MNDQANLCSSSRFFFNKYKRSPPSPLSSSMPQLRPDSSPFHFFFDEKRGKSLSGSFRRLYSSTALLRVRTQIWRAQILSTSFSSWKDENEKARKDTPPLHF
ncbi:hypothetical protein MRB53_013449 [Persea americana]|uniref:Uncharacterized protein n=1 Tax=Persea americana TaxID=3435 RepID=A0ACC2K8M2_PERAE|nr:hypothetical protein MRB53_013449 [Persea americana]